MKKTSIIENLPASACPYITGAAVFVFLIPCIFLGYYGDDWPFLVIFKDVWPGRLNEIFSGSIFRDNGSNHYSPLSGIIYAIGYNAPSPAYIHLMANTFHAITAGLVSVLFRRLAYITPLQSIGAGLLWAFFVSHSMSVYWFAAVGDILCTLFAVLAILIATSEKGEKNRTRSMLLFIGAYALSLLSKEMTVTLPGILFLTGLLTGRLKKIVPYMIAAGVMVGVFMTVRAFALNAVLSVHSNERYFSYGYSTVIALVKYAVSSIFPFPRHIVNLSPLLFLVALPYLFTLITGFVKVKSRTLILLGLLFLTSLVPVINAFSYWYLYFPNVFLILIYIHALKNMRGKAVQIVMPLMLLLNISGFLYVGWTYAQGWSFEQELIREVKKDETFERHFLEIPVSAYSFVPLFSSGEYLEYALLHYAGRKHHFRFALPGMAQSVPKNFSLSRVYVKDKASFVARPDLLYYAAPVDTGRCEIYYNEVEMIGKHPDTAYVFCPDGNYFTQIQAE